MLSYLELIASGRWSAYVCADCDPEYDDDERDDQQGYEQPYVIVVPEGEPTPDKCPRCSSYASWNEMETGLTLSLP